MTSRSQCIVIQARVKAMGKKRYNGVSLSDSSMKVMSQEITVIVTFRVAGAWRRGGQGGGGPRKPRQRRVRQRHLQRSASVRGGRAAGDGAIGGQGRQEGR